MARNNQDDNFEDYSASSVHHRAKGIGQIGLPTFEDHEAKNKVASPIFTPLTPDPINDDITGNPTNFSSSALNYNNTSNDAMDVDSIAINHTDSPSKTEIIAGYETGYANDSYIDEDIYNVERPEPVKSTSINQQAGDELYASPEALNEAKTNAKTALLSTSKARLGLFAGVFFSLLLIGIFSWAVSGDNKKTGDTDSGDASVDLRTDPNAPISEAQARHQMRNAQGEATELAVNGVTNAPVLATTGVASGTDATPTATGQTNGNLSVIAEKYRGINYRTAEISSVPDGDRLLYANSQAANGERQQYYQEPLSNTALYQPKDVRGGEVLTYTNGGITIKPDDYEQRLQRAMQNESAGSGGATNTNNTSNQPSPAQPSQPATDLVYENTKQMLGADYDAFSAEQAAQQAKLEEQRNQAIQAAMALSQTRQQSARNSVNQAIQSLTGSGTGSNYSSQIYGQKYSPFNSASYGNPYVNNNAATTAPSFQNTSNQSDTAGKTQLLPKHIVRAGTSYPVVVTNTVNSDNGSTVTAQLVGGPFNGSKVFGQIEPQGRNIGVSFTALQPKNPRQPLIPINAIALTFNNTSGVASKVNRHYMQNYLTMLAQAGIEGYGNAYANSNTTTMMNDNGTVVTTKGGVDGKQLRGQILASLAGQLSQDIGVFANRQPTFIINQGTPLNLTLVSNLDTTASTPTLNFNNRSLNTGANQ